MAALWRKRARPGAPARSSPPAGAPRAVFGLPTRCPHCATPGYLDRIDLVDGVMYQHCPSCSYRWQTTEAELLSGDLPEAPPG